MTLFIAIYVSVLGLVLGSFFNVVALRVPVGKSIINPPSCCGHCGTKLRAVDLIPVVSYLISRGKCRYCGDSLSFLYPAGEVLTGLLYLWIVLRFGVTPEGMIGLLLVSLTVIISLSDLKYMKIPNKVLLFFAPLLLLGVSLFPSQPWWEHVLGGLLGGGIILLFALRGGMGMGDVKLFAICGFVLGVPELILAFLIACLLGTVIGGGMMLIGRVSRKQPIPFGPWLMIGTLISYGYGSQIIQGYLLLIF